MCFCMNQGVTATLVIASAACSTSKAAMLPSISTTSGSLDRTAFSPPQFVQPKTKLFTRSAWRSANSWAIMPPIEMPNTCARSMPNPSRTPAVSSANMAIEYGSSGLSLRPTPRLSNAMVRKDSAKPGRFQCQPTVLTVNPMMSKSGSPRPCSS